LTNGLAKKGRHVIDVAPQYASAISKNANCQMVVPLTLASREVPVMVGSRLGLPESRISDAACLKRVDVPEIFSTYSKSPRSRWPRSTKSAQMVFAFAACFWDAGYGLSGPVRQVG
jgi:SRSO17 transposase